MIAYRCISGLLALVFAAVAGAAPTSSEPQPGDLLDRHHELFGVVPPVIAPVEPGGAVSADLHWPDKSTIDFEVVGGELVVHYDRPIDDGAARAFARAAGDRLARFDYAYDTLVVRAPPTMSLTAERVPGGVRVTFTPIAVAAAEAVADPSATLALLRAQADAAAGYPGRSRRALARLTAATPANVTLQLALAEAELASDRVVAGAERYRTLGAMPGGLVDARLLDRARRSVGTRVDSSAALWHGRGLDQAELIVGASQPIRADAAIEGGYRLVHTAADGIIDTAGRLQDVSRDVSVGEFGVALRPLPAVRFRALVAGLLDADAVGVAATVIVGDPELQGTARLAWHLPDFTTTEGAVFGGSLDRASIGGFIRPAPGLGLRGDAGLNRYRLARVGIAARTTTVEGSAELLLRRLRPTLTAVYRLDAEYVGRRRTGFSGNPFLPLSSHENHSGEVVAAQPIGAGFAINAAGGWTIDRFGGNGPSASCGVRFASMDGWEVSGLAGVSSVSRVEQRSQRTFGRLTLLKRFRAQA